MSSVQAWTLSIGCWDCLTRIISKHKVWFMFICSFDSYVPAKSLGQERGIFILFCWSGTEEFPISLARCGRESGAALHVFQLSYTNKIYNPLAFSPLCTWLLQVCLTSSSWHFPLILLCIYWVLMRCKHCGKQQKHRVPSQWIYHRNGNIKYYFLEWQVDGSTLNLFPMMGQ